MENSTSDAQQLGSAKDEVGRLINLIPVGLKEAAIDSPTSRASVVHYGEQMDLMALPMVLPRSTHQQQITRLWKGRSRERKRVGMPPEVRSVVVISISLSQ